MRFQSIGLTSWIIGWIIGMSCGSVGLCLFSGCAALKAESSSSPNFVDASDQMQLRSGSEPDSTSPLPATSEPSPSTAKTVVFEEFGLPNYEHLGGIEKIQIDLPYADVRLHRTESPKSPGKITTIILPLSGDESKDLASKDSPKDSGDCKIRAKQEGGLLYLSEKESAPPVLSGTLKIFQSIFPKGLNCRFGIDLELPHSAAVGIDLRRGNVDIENWSNPVGVRIGWGDLNLGSVKEVSLKCGRCNLAGENVEGPVTYEIEHGNVGLDGIQHSVQGKTHGDTILHWAKVTAETSVNVSTRAGEMILTFPNGVAISPEFTVDRGEIISTIPAATRGVPVVAKVGLGNLRIYRQSP